LTLPSQRKTRTSRRASAPATLFYRISLISLTLNNSRHTILPWLTSTHFVETSIHQSCRPVDRRCS
jgi:hypothetical protein